MIWHQETKEKIQYTLAIVVILVGLGLSIAGFVVDPQGEIDGSVLAITGECLTFAGAIFGISIHYGSELRNFKREINRELKSKEDEIC